MDAKYLDTLLKVLQSKAPQAITLSEFTCTPNVHSKYESNARLMLVERGYIFQSNEAPYYIGINGEGLLFLNQGGFQKEEKLKNLPFDTVKIAKQSRTISVCAIVISVLVAIAVAYFKFRTQS